MADATWTEAEIVALIAAGSYASPPTEDQMKDGVLRAEIWLAEHDAKVRAEALRDAATWVEELAVHDGLMYREFDDGEEVAESIPTALRVRADRIEREAGLK